jgi:hypothetical protein
MDPYDTSYVLVGTTHGVVKLHMPKVFDHVSWEWDASGDSAAAKTETKDTLHSAIVSRNIERVEWYICEHMYMSQKSDLPLSVAYAR